MWQTGLTVSVRSVFWKKSQIDVATLKIKFTFASATNRKATHKTQNFVNFQFQIPHLSQNQT